MSVFVIAEAGVNHDGDADRAFSLIEAARKAGADAVKFQTFRAQDVVTAAAPKAEYQRRRTQAEESQLEMLRRLELSHDVHRALAARCREIGIAFLSTPFDLESLEFLVQDLGLGLLKLPSGELNNGPLLLAAARSGADIILSTGMATLHEVREALGVLAYGYGTLERPSGREIFAKMQLDALSGRVRLLHCTTEYPAPYDEINLRAMDTLSETFGLPSGLSDHSSGISVAIAAVARGATVIEKHFTLDRTLPGPDHAASLEPAELKTMIEGIRAVERALGTSEKRPTASERANMLIARKSLVARRAIRKGEFFSEDNLTVRRPGTGVSPMAYWDFLGRRAPFDIAENEEVPPWDDPSS